MMPSLSSTAAAASRQRSSCPSRPPAFAGSQERLLQSQTGHRPHLPSQPGSARRRSARTSARWRSRPPLQPDRGGEPAERRHGRDRDRRPRRLPPGGGAACLRDHLRGGRRHRGRQPWSVARDARTDPGRVSQLWDYVAFVLNSLVFILIGATMPLTTLVDHLGLVAVGAGIVLGRPGGDGLRPPARRPAAGPPISLRWQHLLVWGGMRRAVAGAPVPSLPASDPNTLTIQGARLRRGAQYPGDSGHYDPTGGQVPPAPRGAPRCEGNRRAGRSLRVRRGC
jgi:hypothetical protein